MTRCMAVQAKYQSVRSQLIKQKEYSDMVHTEYKKLEDQLQSGTFKHLLHILPVLLGIFVCYSAPFHTFRFNILVFPVWCAW